MRSNLKRMSTRGCSFAILLAGVSLLFNPLSALHEYLPAVIMYNTIVLSIVSIVLTVPVIILVYVINELIWGELCIENEIQTTRAVLMLAWATPLLLGIVPLLLISYMLLVQDDADMGFGGLAIGAVAEQYGVLVFYYLLTSVLAFLFLINGRMLGVYLSALCVVGFITIYIIPWFEMPPLLSEVFVGSAGSIVLGFLFLFLILLIIFLIVRAWRDLQSVGG